MKILACSGYMGEFDIIKIFCINYLECMKNEKETCPLFLFMSKILNVIYFFDFIKNIIN